MPNAFQPLNFQRQNECLTLRRALKFFPIVHVTGLEGVGKTTILKDFLIQNQLTNFWISLSNSFTLHDVTEQIASRPEQVIIWDNLHQLSKANQQKLIFSASQNLTHKKSIFISDEVIEPLSNEPILKIGALTKEQCAEFFDFFESGYTEKQVNQIYERTGGLIGQLKLCLIDPDASSSAEPFLKSISQSARQELKLIAASSLDFNESELDTDCLSELRRRFLIVIESGGSVQCPQFLKSAIRQFTPPDELKVLGQNASKIFLGRPGTPEPIKLYCALEALDLDGAINFAQRVSLNEIEEFSPSHIKSLVELLGRESKKYSVQKYWKLARIYIHVLILSNRRAEAIAFCRTLLDTTSWDQLDEEKFMLAYDVIYWINRSAAASEIDSKRNRLINLAKRPLLFLFQIEQIFVANEKIVNCKEAIISLNRIKADILKFVPTSPFAKEVVALAMGNCLFQLGIQHLAIQDYAEGILAFENAQKYFEEIGRKYLMLFCELNYNIGLFYQNKMNLLQDRLKVLKLQAQLNGYPYLQSAVSMLMADSFYTNLEPSKALTEIEDAISRTDEGMPMNTRASIAAAKLRIVNELGLVEITHTLFQQFIKSFEKQVPILAKTLALETQIRYKTTSQIIEWLESAEGSEKEGNHLEIYLLQRGVNLGDKLIASLEGGHLREAVAVESII